MIIDRIGLHSVSVSVCESTADFQNFCDYQCWLKSTVYRYMVRLGGVSATFNLKQKTSEFTTSSDTRT